MTVRLQFPPSIESTLEVVAVDHRSPLRLMVESLDGGSYRLVFRWAGTENGVAVAVLESIEDMHVGGKSHGYAVHTGPPPRALLTE